MGLAGGRAKEMIADTVEGEKLDRLKGELPPHGEAPPPPGRRLVSDRGPGRDEAYRRAEVDRARRANPHVGDNLVLGVVGLLVGLMLVVIYAGRRFGWW